MVHTRINPLVHTRIHPTVHTRIHPMVHTRIHPMVHTRNPMVHTRIDPSDGALGFIMALVFTRLLSDSSHSDSSTRISPLGFFPLVPPRIYPLVHVCASCHAAVFDHKIMPNLVCIWCAIGVQCTQFGVQCTQFGVQCAFFEMQFLACPRINPILHRNAVSSRARSL